MCPSLFSQLSDAGCNESVLAPRSLGRLWLQAADADGIDAPKLVAKRTFLEFEFSDRSPKLSRCSSDGDIKYGGECQPDIAQCSSSNVSQVHSPMTSPVSAPEREGPFSPGPVCVNAVHCGFVAVPVFVPLPKPAAPYGIMEALNAKKAALGDTVAQLSLAALKAEAPVTTKKQSSTRTARRAKKMQAKAAPNIVSQVLPTDTIDSEADSSTGSEIVEQTTIMLRKLPLTYTRKLLLDLLDSEGFKGRYDFVYLPSNFETSLGFGYAFVNFSSEDDAEFARQHFEGFNKWATESQEVCETSWSDPYQGLAANVERYRNSPVMHESIADEYKPIIFLGGVRQTFPAPTKLIKAPKNVHRSIPLSSSTRMAGA